MARRSRGKTGESATTNHLRQLFQARLEPGIYATRNGSTFSIDSLALTTGADFFKEYRQFGGLTSNAKLQLKLPNAWFAV